MKKTIVIFGITGTQGGSVATKFLSLPNWHIRGITRNASSPSALALTSQGVEVVQANLNIPSTLSNIFHGAHVIFLITDFWNPYLNAPESIKSSPSDKASGEYAYDIEVTQGKIAIDYIAKALRDEGILEHFIFSSLPDARGGSAGKYGYVFHWDGKAVIEKYIKESYPLLHAKTSLLYVALYFDNITKYSGQSLGIRKSPKDSSYVLPIPMSSKTLHPFVHPRDTGPFVDLLVKTAPGKVLLGVGEYLSWEGFANLWTEIVGKVLKCEEKSVEEWDRDVPGGFGREYAEGFAFLEEFGWGAGNEGKMILPKDLDPNIKLTSAREFIERENWEKFLD